MIATTVNISKETLGTVGVASRSLDAQHGRYGTDETASDGGAYLSLALSAQTETRPADSRRRNIVVD
jgi:hypothetical protein